MLVEIVSLIAFGGFARVYVAQVTHSNRLPAKSKLALKKAHVVNEVPHPVLLHEVVALVKLRGHESVPNVYAWGRSRYFEYIAMQLLGPPIQSMSKQECRPTMRNLVAVTCQMLDALAHVHRHQIIHGDIKPDNWVFGTGEHDCPAGRVYLIDYGLAKWYVDPKTSKHIEEGTVPAFRGTVPYASLNAHYHRMPSRRDDMESLAYTLLHLLRGSLPWDEEDYEDMLGIKGNWTGPALCGDYPPVFGAFLEYARGMKFDEEPDYKFWREQFRLLVLEKEKEEPLPYDASDQNAPFVGTTLGSGRPGDVHLAPPPTEHDDDEFVEDFGFVPTSTWPLPDTVPPQDLLGDEEEIAKSVLERFDEPPEFADGETYLCNGYPEVMYP
ncbi:kinase-like domain-containing protein [Mycena galopus ATCC 62051]|nr:kinase-like domain-containing protein [Mycena galopus ATCC 62051]